MVCPSIYPALHDPVTYPNPDTFDPDRWITGNADKQTKNWLVFGTAAHDCPGQNYAMLNLIVLIANASLHLKWKHRITRESEEIKLRSTKYLKDACILAFKERDICNEATLQGIARLDQSMHTLGHDKIIPLCRGATLGIRLTMYVLKLSPHVVGT